jgi:hypothetical protein
MPTEIEKAERDLSNLEQQREAIVSRAAQLDKQRKAIAFAALTAGDKQSKLKLAEINAEDIGLAANIASVEAALTVARANLEAAHAAEARSVDREKAERIAALNMKFREQLLNADDAFADAINSVLSAKDLLAEMHSLGVANPIDNLFRINSVTCVKTIIQKLPTNWCNDFEFMRLSPGQKTEFKKLAAAWADQIERQNAARLGEDKKKDAA